MINGNYKEFMNEVYYGSELNFSYKDKKYFYQGWKENGIHHREIYQFVPNLDGYFWTYDSKNAKDCVRAFLSAKIFDGKTFPEIEKEVEWLEFGPLDVHQETKEYWEKHKDEIPKS